MRRGRIPGAAAPREWRGLVAQIERAATPLGRERIGRYAIEGLRLHERALRAGIALDATLLGAGFGRSDAREARLVEALGAASLQPVSAPDAVLDRLVGGRGQGAVVSLVALPAAPELRDLLRESGARVLVLHDVEDPGNVGALVRTALAGGAAGVLCCGKSDPFHPRAVRTSMGSLFRLPLLRRPAGVAVLDELRRAGATSIGAVAVGGTPLPEFEPPAGALALWVGSEAFGLDPGIAAALDARVTIPMPPAAVDSYSVNAAAAIVLYDLGRDRAARDPEVFPAR